MSGLLELAEYLISLDDDPEERAVANLRTIIQMARDAMPPTWTSTGVPTPDQVGRSIHGMVGILKMLTAFDDLPFLENVESAIENYDAPGIRQELVRLLYAEVDRNAEV